MSLFLHGGSHLKIRFLSSIRLHPNPPAKISFVIQKLSSIVTASAIGMLLAKYPLPNGDYGLLSFVEVPVELLTAGSQAADGAGFQLFASRSKKQIPIILPRLSGVSGIYLKEGLWLAY